MTLPAFDIDDAVDRVDGDIEFLAELTKDFINSFPEQFAEMELAIKNSDPIKAEQKAHSLKGALNNLGARKSADVAHSIVVASKLGDLQAVEQLAVKFQDHVYEFASAFTEFLKSKGLQ